MRSYFAGQKFLVERPFHPFPGRASLTVISLRYKIKKRLRAVYPFLSFLPSPGGICVFQDSHTLIISQRQWNKWIILFHLHESLQPGSQYSNVPHWSRIPSLPQSWGTVSSSSCPVCLARAGLQFLLWIWAEGCQPPKVSATSGREAKHYWLLLASSAPSSFPMWTWSPQKRWRIGWLVSPYHIIISSTRQIYLITHLLARLHFSSTENSFNSSNFLPLWKLFVCNKKILGKYLLWNIKWSSKQCNDLHCTPTS